MKQKIRLQAQLIEGMCDDYSKKKIIRTLDFVDGSSLRLVAEFIIGSFDFDCDHAFGIYDDVRSPNEGYSLFADINDEGDPMGGKSIEKAKVGRVFREEGKEMFMLFDYGDEWIFKIVCEEVMPRPEGKTGYPYTVFRQGKAPEQYPEY